jgi:hypothetical protein
MVYSARNSARVLASITKPKKDDMHLHVYAKIIADSLMLTSSCSIFLLTVAAAFNRCVTTCLGSSPTYEAEDFGYKSGYKMDSFGEIRDAVESSLCIARTCPPEVKRVFTDLTMVELGWSRERLTTVVDLFNEVETLYDLTRPHFRLLDTPLLDNVLADSQFGIRPVIHPSVEIQVNHEDLIRKHRKNSVDKETESNASFSSRKSGKKPKRGAHKPPGPTANKQ